MQAIAVARVFPTITDGTGHRGRVGQPRAAAASAAPITGASSIRRSSSCAGSSTCVTRHTVHLDRRGATFLPFRPGPNTVRFRA